MGTATLEIGGLRFRMGGGDSLAMVMSLPGMSDFMAGDGEGVLTLTLDADVPPATQFSVLHSFDILEGTAECRFGIDTDGAYRYLFSSGGELRCDPRRADHAECSAMTSPDALRFAVWLAYGMMAAPHGRLPIHSSTVVHRERAVLCLGESGTGKSTHTRLWLNNILQCHLLNDDSPIVAATDEGTVVYGSPWSGKTHCYRREHYPVAALLRLEQRPQNTIHRLPTLEAFGAVQPSLPPTMGYDERLLDLQVDIVSHIVATTPVYRMGCLPDADAARMSHDTIFHHADD